MFVKKVFMLGWHADLEEYAESWRATIIRPPEDAIEFAVEMMVKGKLTALELYESEDGTIGKYLSITSDGSYSKVFVMDAGEDEVLRELYNSAGSNERIEFMGDICLGTELTSKTQLLKKIIESFCVAGNLANLDAYPEEWI